MPHVLSPARFRRTGVVVGVAVAVVVLLLSHAFGRAQPTGNYRPPRTTDAIASGCYPLPGNVQLDGLAYQVRRDRDVRTKAGPRRQLRGQYDLVGRDEAVARIVAAFAKAGFRERSRRTDGRSLVVQLARGKEAIGVTAADLPGTDEDTLVRGEFVLDLPVVEVAKDDPVCSDVTSTKRYGDRHPPHDPWVAP